jgi:hypothetical protein
MARCLACVTRQQFLIKSYTLDAFSSAWALYVRLLIQILEASEIVPSSIVPTSIGMTSETWISRERFSVADRLASSLTNNAIP